MATITELRNQIAAVEVGISQLNDGINFNMQQQNMAMLQDRDEAASEYGRRLESLRRKLGEEENKLEQLEQQLQVAQQEHRVN